MDRCFWRDWRFVPHGCSEVPAPTDEDKRIAKSWMTSGKPTRSDRVSRSGRGIAADASLTFINSTHTSFDSPSVPRRISFLWRGFDRLVGGFRRGSLVTRAAGRRAGMRTVAVALRRW
ncbi:hypothetical protein KCP69_14745 [Salmonella enterica subsp. enterica]|nr:hypothetical protein KCP69_14745 [Salmonella enterica subsp. enterica]